MSLSNDLLNRLGVALGSGSAALELLNNLGGGGSGTVSSVALTVPGFLSVSGSPVTTSGTLAVSLAAQAANIVFAGPGSGGNTAPTFRALVAADIPNIAESQVTNLVSDLAAKGSGTVSSIALSVPNILSVAGSPVTTSGTLAVTLATQTANIIFAGPSSGGAAAPAFRALVAADIPNIAESQVTNLTTDLAAKAPLASPTFTGIPVAPTATVGTNTTQLATTAFVLANAGGTSISQGGGSVSVASDGTITATTAASKALTLSGAASSGIALSTVGAITITPASGQNVTVASGTLNTIAGTLSSSALSIGGSANYGFAAPATSTLYWGYLNGGPCHSWADNGPYYYKVGNTVSIQWSSTASAAGTADLALARGGPGILRQANAGNAQVFQVFNTTDGTNSEYFVIDWQTTSNVCTIGTAKTGTGTQRAWTFQGPASSSVAINASGVITLTPASGQNVTMVGDLSSGGNLIATAAGKGLQVKSGSNARIGTGTLSSGTLTVANTSVTANTRVFLTDTTSGSLTNVGSLTVVTSAGTGFVVTSSNVLDTSTFNWLLVESN